jgi:hypothetical protein
MALALNPPTVEDSQRTQDAFPAPLKTPKSERTKLSYECQQLFAESPLKKAFKGMKRAVSSIATALTGKATTSKDVEKAQVKGTFIM